MYDPTNTGHHDLRGPWYQGPVSTPSTDERGEACSTGLLTTGEACVVRGAHRVHSTAGGQRWLETDRP